MPTPPLADFCGVDSFDYTVADHSGLLDAATVTLDIACTNDPPVALDDTYDVVHDTPLDVPAPGVLANDGDPNGDTFVALLASAPGHGTLRAECRRLLHLHAQLGAMQGPDSFAYKANDGALDSKSATVTLMWLCA